MKISKPQLKAIIKECLIELLAEGLGGNLNEAVAVRTVHQTLEHKKPILPSRQPIRSNVSSALTEAVRASSGGNAVLQDILADTAATTLQTQMGAESRGPAVATDAVSMVVAEHSPEDLFGSEAASKWADLAFNSPSPQR